MNGRSRRVKSDPEVPQTESIDAKLETSYAKFLKGLVVCAVPCEPVSTEYFPVIREFNREVRDF